MARFRRPLLLTTVFIVIISRGFLPTAANETSITTQSTAHNYTDGLTTHIHGALSGDLDTKKADLEDAKNFISSAFDDDHDFKDLYEDDDDSDNNRGRGNEYSHDDYDNDDDDDYDNDEEEDYYIDDDDDEDEGGGDVFVSLPEFSEDDSEIHSRVKRKKNGASKVTRPRNKMRNKGGASFSNPDLKPRPGETYSNEYHIKRKLLTGYDKTTRPVRNDSETVTVEIGLSLYHILDTNEKFQTLSALIAVRLKWIDEYLTWDPDEYGGVQMIWLPTIDIWRPDVFINNFADDSFQDFMNTYSIVQHTGQVLWMFPAVIKTYCTLDVRHFPFDQQKCQIIFISWTFNGFKLNFTNQENITKTDMVYYTPKNQEWYVDDITVIRNEKVYACCPEPYPDVTFTIHMTRRSLFYIVNLIFPCLLIYGVSFLGFFLPVESGEKVNLEITILLALVVFLLIVGETLPPTPDAIPVLGLLFGMTMFMVSVALVMAVLVTNIYLRKDSGNRMHVCLRRIFLPSKVHRSSLSNKVNGSENHVLETRMIGGEQRILGPRIQDYDFDNYSQQSDLDSAFCRSGCSQRRSSLQRNQSDMSRDDKITWEWMTLARCVDRINFWLFLFTSVAALLIMFAQIPAYQPI